MIIIKIYIYTRYVVAWNKWATSFIFSLNNKRNLQINICTKDNCKWYHDLAQYTAVNGNNSTADELLISCVGVGLLPVSEWVSDATIDVDVGDDLYRVRYRAALLLR